MSLPTNKSSNIENDLVSAADKYGEFSVVTDGAKCMSVKKKV